VISSNARSALNDASDKRVIGKDTRYLHSICDGSNDNSSGVYSAVMSETSALIYLSDEAKNIRYSLVNG
jgi:hypothetical protein